MRRYSGHAMRVRGLAVLIAVTAGSLAAAGCGGGSTAPKTGSLTVTITAPGSVTPNVTVSGPAGSRALTATTTLTGLAVGNYTVTAASVNTTDPIVSTVNTGTVTGSPASVTANGTATATATYAQRSGTGGLWIGNLNASTVVEYSAAQLASTTSAAAATAIGTGAPLDAGVALDGNGNLWVAEEFANSLVEFTASQLASTGTPAPAVILTASSGSLDGPLGLAFDASGNLWVSNIGNNTVVQLSASQLASSGSPIPAVTIGASSGSLNNPFGLAFDASGDLWAVNEGGNTVVKFTPNQLAASGSPTPAVILSANAGSLDGPLSVAFDANGNLWVTNGGSSTVVQFSARQLTTTGAPTPAVVLTATAGSLNDPTGLAFDNSGNLWVANTQVSSVVEFTGSQLVTSGSPTPSVTISGSSLSNPSGIAFDPHATSLPLKP